MTEMSAGMRRPRPWTVWTTPTAWLSERLHHGMPGPGRGHEDAVDVTGGDEVAEAVVGLLLVEVLGDHHRVAADPRLGEGAADDRGVDGVGELGDEQGQRVRRRSGE